MARSGNTPPILGEKTLEYLRLIIWSNPFLFATVLLEQRRRRRADVAALVAAGAGL